MEQSQSLPLFVYHLIMFITAVFCVAIMTPLFVNMPGCCLLPNHCRCDHQSRALWILSSRWVSGTHKGFPTVIKDIQTHTLKNPKQTSFTPEEICKLACCCSTPVCKSSPFLAGEFCPTATNLRLSLAWKVWEKKYTKKPHKSYRSSQKDKEYKHILCANCLQLTAVSEAPTERKTRHSMGKERARRTYFRLSLKKPGLSAWTITTSNRSLQSFPTM